MSTTANASHWPIMLPELSDSLFFSPLIFFNLVSMHRWSSCCHSVGTSLCYLRLTSSWCSWSKCLGESRGVFWVLKHTYIYIYIYIFTEMLSICMRLLPCTCHIIFYNSVTCAPQTSHTTHQNICVHWGNLWRYFWCFVVWFESFASSRYLWA